MDFAKLRFGERLRLAREGVGLTQVELAKVMGVAQNQISVWEKGPTGPKRERLPALAAAVGATTDWLLDGKGRGPQRRRKARQTLDVPVSRAQARMKAEGELDGS